MKNSKIPFKEFKAMSKEERRAFKKSGGKFEHTRGQTIFAYIATAIIGVSVAKCAFIPESKEEIERREFENRHAYVAQACRTFIDRNLNDSGSAEYQERERDANVVEFQHNVFVVTRTVKAKNMFNAYIKTSFTCTIKKNASDGSYSLIRLKEG